MTRPSRLMRRSLDLNVPELVLWHGYGTRWCDLWHSYTSKEAVRSDPTSMSSWSHGLRSMVGVQTVRPIDALLQTARCCTLSGAHGCLYTVVMMQVPLASRGRADAFDRCCVSLRLMNE